MRGGSYTTGGSYMANHAVVRRSDEMQKCQERNRGNGCPIVNFIIELTKRRGPMCKLQDEPRVARGIPNDPENSALTYRQKRHYRV
jgi:hypothetical protein